MRKNPAGAQRTAQNDCKLLILHELFSALLLVKVWYNLGNVLVIFHRRYDITSSPQGEECAGC